MNESAMRAGDRRRATYEFQPVDHLVRHEMPFWPETVERWKKEGLPEDWGKTNLFQFDDTGLVGTGVGNALEPWVIPGYEEKVLESDENYETFQDRIGRTLKRIRGKSHWTHMHLYMVHPVTDMKTWEAYKPRFDPQNSKRWEGLPERVRNARTRADAMGGFVGHWPLGAHMFLRSLLGPEHMMYMFFDQPELIHAVMKGWFDLEDAALRRVQEHVEVDEIGLGEDNCYNHGLLLSPDLMHEFIWPYYHQYIDGARARQKRKLYLHYHSDGDYRPAIPLYQELGLHAVSPCEVAAGCDVVQMSQDFPNLVLGGGIDKRVLAAGKDAIDRHLEYIVPFMVKRGGYIPTCDHAVPYDVSLDNYLHYRKRMCELDHA